MALLWIKDKKWTIANKHWPTLKKSVTYPQNICLLFSKITHNIISISLFLINCLLFWSQALTTLPPFHKSLSDGGCSCKISTLKDLHYTSSVSLAVHGWSSTWLITAWNLLGTLIFYSSQPPRAVQQTSFILHVLVSSMERWISIHSRRTRWLQADRRLTRPPAKSRTCLHFILYFLCPSLAPSSWYKAF